MTYVEQPPWVRCDHCKRTVTKQGARVLGFRGRVMSAEKGHLKVRHYCKNCFELEKPPGTYSPVK